jgi:TolA-binding protein
MNENYVIDVIANLARRVLEIERELLEYKTLGIRDHLREGNNVLNNRVTSLEQQLRDTQGNVEKLAEELANVKHLTESNEQDIAMLDERTRPTEEPVTPDESIPQYWAEALIRFYGGNR